MRTVGLSDSWPSSPSRRGAAIRRLTPPAFEIHARESEIAKAPALISEAERHHDFGVAISRPGRTLTHVYPLVNRTDHVLKIEGKNHRRCCGEVTLSQSELRPGESAEVTVVLSVSEKFGAVVHTAEVTADPPLAEPILLRTTATAYPAVRIEEEVTGEAALIRGGPAGRGLYRIIATGTDSDPPLDLARLEPTSATPARWDGPPWDGPPTTGPGEDGLTLATRRLAVTLGADGEPGTRKALSVLKDGDRGVFEHPITWEVITPLTVTPPTLIVRPGMREARVILRSRDRAQFRVTEIRNERAGLRARAERDDSASMHTLKIQITGAEADGKGGLIIATDHPSQPTIAVPVLVLEGANSDDREAPR